MNSLSELGERIVEWTVLSSIADRVTCGGRRNRQRDDDEKNDKTLVEVGLPKYGRKGFLRQRGFREEVAEAALLTRAPRDKREDVLRLLPRHGSHNQQRGAENAVQPGLNKVTIDDGSTGLQAIIASRPDRLWDSRVRRLLAVSGQGMFVIKFSITRRYFMNIDT